MSDMGVTSGGSGSGKGVWPCPRGTSGPSRSCGTSQVHRTQHRRCRRDGSSRRLPKCFKDTLRAPPVVVLLVPHGGAAGLEDLNDLLDVAFGESLRQLNWFAVNLNADSAQDLEPHHATGSVAEHRHAGVEAFRAVDFDVTQVDVDLRHGAPPRSAGPARTRG